MTEETGVAIQSVSGTAVPVIAALHRACIEPGWDETAIGEILGMPGTVALLAMEGETPVGFALVGRAADEAEVLSIGVLPVARRRGIGLRLLAAVMDAARHGGAGRMFLEVAEDNGPAIAFYENAGFTRVGRRSGYYSRASGRADALVMRKSI